MKRQKLSDYLGLIESAIDRQDYNKAKRLGEIALKKLHSFSYSPHDEYLLYKELGVAYLNLAEFSRSLDIFYRAYQIASRHAFPQAEIIRISCSMGRNFLMMRNLELAIVQFRKVEQYYKEYGDNIPPMDNRLEVVTLLGLGYCYLGKNDLEKARDIIKNRLSSDKFILSDKFALLNYNHLKGEYLIAIKEYKQARESFQECIKLGEQLNFPIGRLEAKIHLAEINLRENKIDDAIKALRENLKDARRLKLNDLVCESGLLLSKCYLLKGMPDKSASIEERIKPVLSELDTVWLYEKTREFEKLYRQLSSTPTGLGGHSSSKSHPVPAVLLTTLDHRYETSPYKEMVIGSSTAMQEAFKLIEKIAPSDLPILIQGETGTGKELIAQAIHANSPRSNNIFLAFNCGAIPETLAEGALFGHTRGAFTGAEQDKKGYIELASGLPAPGGARQAGGTLFIDEISNMSAGMQQKLLRVLEEDLVWPIGAQKETPVNTRFIFASNKNIEQMVKQKVFREDLFYRLNTIVLNLPALRERKEDIPLLVEHFLKKYATGMRNAEWGMGNEKFRIPDSTLRILMDYPWPGNIRELENEIQRIIVLHPDAKLITELMLSAPIRDYPLVSSSLQGKTTIKDLTASFQRNIIVEAFKEYNGDIKRICGHLGYARSGLYKKLKELKIDPKFVTQR